jgi:hypothetical protein
MLLSELLTEVKIPNELWHFTNAKHKESIEREGIIARKSGNWVNKKAVYLTNSTDDVLELFGEERPPKEGMIGIKIDVSEIKSELKLDPDFEQHQVAFAWYYEGDIHPSDIIEIKSVHFTKTRLGYQSKIE